MSDASAELDKFVVDLSKHLDLSASVVMRKLTFDAWLGVVEKTPVDTGRAQSSWNVGVGDSDISIPGITEGSNYPTEPNLSLIDGTSAVFITSSLDYIEALENGHSDQAPYGMIAITVAEIAAGLDTLQEEINNKL